MQIMKKILFIIGFIILGGCGNTQESKISSAQDIITNLESKILQLSKDLDTIYKDEASINTTIELKDVDGISAVLVRVKYSDNLLTKFVGNEMNPTGYGHKIKLAHEKVLGLSRKLRLLLDENNLTEFPVAVSLDSGDNPLIATLDNEYGYSAFDKKYQDNTIPTDGELCGKEGYGPYYCLGIQVDQSLGEVTVTNVSNKTLYGYFYVDKMFDEKKLKTETIFLPSSGLRAGETEVF